jgi:hypothetical protein
VLKGEAVNRGLLHPPETSYAEAASGAQVNLKGKFLKAEVIDEKAKPPSVRHIQGATHLTAFAVSDSGSDESFYQDPLTLSFFDEVSGDLIAQNDLFDESWLVQGTADILYDPNVGLTLTANHDSLSSISFSTLSSWVLNPFNGTASIQNGIFQATGDLARLPWVVTSTSNTQAFLPISSLLLDFKFDIEATGLGNPSNDLIMKLTNEAQGLTSDYKTADVPEPLTILGSATALGFGTFFKRKLKSSESLEKETTKVG